MTTKLITVSKDTDLFTARNLMKEHRIRHLPVVVDDELIGIITIQSIAWYSQHIKTYNKAVFALLVVIFT